MNAGTKSVEKVKTTADGSSRVRTPAHGLALSSQSSGLSFAETQQAVGNLAVQRMFQGGMIRAKLSISQPGDPDEEEADRVADQVMQMPDSSLTGACPKCAEQTPSPVRRKTNGAGSPVRSPVASHVIEYLGDGHPLDKSTRSFFEPRLGADLSHVRIHSDEQAAESARSIQARAFTEGSNIVFGAGEYVPDSRAGRTLLAHEFTHIVQSAPARADAATNDSAEITGVARRPRATRHAGWIARQTQEGTGVPPLSISDLNAIKVAVDRIMDALEGYTSRDDSENILGEFRGKGSNTVQALISEVRSRAWRYKNTPEGMVDWLLGDLTEENRRELRRILIRSNAPDMVRLVMLEVKERLEGYTSEADSTEIYQVLSGFSGSGLDLVLTVLEVNLGLGHREMALWLFGDLDRANAQRLRRHFFDAGGVRSVLYAVDWTVAKILNLLSGYTSHSDSTDIAWNFETTPPAFRSIVLGKLNELCQADRLERAEDSLMQDMDQSDYEKLRILGLPLRGYDRKRGFFEKILSGVEWAEVVAEWLVCGVGGIITGLLSVVWDLLKLVKDIVISLWDLLWSLVYLLSGGAAGSENWLAVKNFFTGVGKIFTEPGKVWDELWSGLSLEFRTIEGPFADCRRAEFIVRKFVNVLVNVILIFLFGYGAVKGAASAAQRAAQFAVVAREIGAVRALGQAAGRVARATGKFISGTVAEVAELSSQLARPGEMIARIASRLKLVLLSIEDEGLWRYARGQLGKVGAEKRAAETKFWQERRQFWRDRALSQQQKQADLAADVEELSEKLKDQRIPENKSAVESIADDARKLDDDSAALYNEVTNAAESKGVIPATSIPDFGARAHRLEILIRRGPFPADTRAIGAVIVEVEGYTGATELRAISGAATDPLALGAEVPHAVTPSKRTLSAARSIGGASTRGEFPFSHLNDAEIKLLEQVKLGLPHDAEGTIHILSMRSRAGGTVIEPLPMCSSCTRAVFEVIGDHPGIDIVSHSVTVPAPNIDIGQLKVLSRGKTPSSIPPTLGTAAETRFGVTTGQQVVIYRGSAYRYIAGRSTQVHDLGEGTYWSYEMEQGVRFAQIRRAEVQVVEPGGLGVVLRSEIKTSELGRILDFYNNPAERGNWEAYVGRQPGGQYVLHGGPAEMYNAHLENWLTSRALRLQDFDVIIGPDYIHGGSQICIRNKEIAATVLSRAQEVAKAHEPVTAAYPDIPER